MRRGKTTKQRFTKQDIQDALLRVAEGQGITKLAEFVEAFESEMPLAEIAKHMTSVIRSKKSSERDKMYYMSFFLTAKKFVEKSEPAIGEEELQAATDEDLRRIFETQFDMIHDQRYVREHPQEIAEVPGAP